MAFAARCLIRLTSLVPEVVDVRQLGKDLEAIAHALTQGEHLVRRELTPVPGFQYADLLRQVLLKARRENVLPPASPAGLNSPHSFNVEVTHMPAMPDAMPFDTNMPMRDQPVPAMGLLDFGYAEQLLNNENGGMVNPQSFFVSRPSCSADVRASTTRPRRTLAPHPWTRHTISIHGSPFRL